MKSFISIGGMLLLALLLLSSHSYAQSDTLSKREIRKARPLYFTLQAGGGVSHFVDFATSPLSYLGSHSHLGIGHIRMDKNREFGFMLENTIGMYTNYQSDLLANSTGITYQLSYHRLYGVPAWNNAKQNVKFGGKAILFGDTRINQSLMNHTLGFEGFFNLMASAQYARNISRTSYSEKKILFLTWKRKAVHRFLQAHMDIGLFNSNLRNGYNYMGQGQLINQGRLLDDYSFYTFSGFRMGASLSYNVYRQNGNLLQFAYTWNALKSGKEFSVYQMALHSFTVRLMIQQNPKQRRNFDESLFN